MEDRGNEGGERRRAERGFQIRGRRAKKDGKKKAGGLERRRIRENGEEDIVFEGGGLEEEKGSGRTEALTAVAYLLEGTAEEVNQREPENQGEHPALAQEPAPQQRRKVQHPGRAQAQ